MEKQQKKKKKKKKFGENISKFHYIKSTGDHTENI